MKHVLVLLKPSPLRDYIELVLGSNKEINLITYGKASEALSFIDLEPELDLIFIGHALEVDINLLNFTTAIKTYAQANNIAVIGSNKGIAKVDYSQYLHPLSPIDKTLDFLKSKLEIKKSSFTSTDFIPIPVSLCLHMSTVPCDLHLKIGKNTDARYIKRFKKNEAMEIDVLKNLIEKELARVYIHKEDLELLNNLYKKKMIQDKAPPKTFSEYESIKFFTLNMKDSLEYVTSVLEEIKLKHAGGDLVNNIFGTIQEDALKLHGKNKKLISKMFSDSLISEDDFATKHVSLTSLLGLNALKYAKWGSSEMITKFVYAASFHNFNLKGNKKLIRATNEKELAQLSEEEIEIVMHHPFLLIEELKDAHILPAGVDRIILEHHGSKNGIGLPQEKQCSSKLSTLFMITSELACKILLRFESTGGKLDLDKLISEELEKVRRIDREVFELLEQSLKVEN